MTALQSRHFKVEEFACRDGTPYPADWIADRLMTLTFVLDQIRDAWGGPLTVVSGYRTPEYNAKIAGESAARNARTSGVASSSQHVQGRAADIAPSNPTPERVAQLHKLIRHMYGFGQLSVLGGLGVYPHWCHVDIRVKTGGHLATWVGVGAATVA